MKTESKNKNLGIAKVNKNDEFYTQLTDIEKELRYYKEHFKDKVVYCNCDDPYESKFFKYFAMNFEHLKLKKLIATCYIGSPIANKELILFDYESKENKTTRSPHKIEITKVPDMNNDGAIDLMDVKLLLASDRNHLTRLKGDGDFSSAECIELLKEADIVVTNPPFSLFRKYVAQLMEYGKKFLILGNDNCRTYKEVFKLFQENKMWCGYNHVTNFIDNKGKEHKMGNVSWYTNLDIKKYHEEISFYKFYEDNPSFYPKYDNFDAIEVSKTKDIPRDYTGAMGVPITFLDKFNPEQFEIVGITNQPDLTGIPYTKNCFAEINSERKYVRLFIKHKNPESKRDYYKRLNIKYYEH